MKTPNFVPPLLRVTNPDRFWQGAGVASLCLAAAGGLYAAKPELHTILPRGAMRGGEAAFTLHGVRLQDVEEAFVLRPGVTVRELAPAEDGNSVALKLELAADCPLGEHYVRLRARSGLSEVKTFWVGQFPQVAETEPNNDINTAQHVDLNVTIEGVAENEDVDLYSVELKKGQRLSVEVEGLRLNGNFFDPYVAILDAKRFELATADDTALLAQDPYAQIIAPEDGTYYVLVRDSSYVGNVGCRYRMHVGTFPRPSGVYPAGGKAGTEVEVTFVGDAAGPWSQKITLPAESQPKWGAFAVQEGVSAPSANWMRVSEFENVLEAEPNDDLAHATVTEAELPLAFNGVIGQPGDVDHFRFSAKKDQKFSFIAHAKSIRSPLDPVLEIRNKDHAVLAANDDAIGPDAKIDFTAPYDGEYYLTVYDHLRQGAPDYIYRIEAAPAAPSLTLSIPQFARYDYQSRQMMPVPRGNRVAAVVNGNRVNFSGDLMFEAPDLPPGVTLISDVMPQSSGGGYPVVFEAAPDAPLGGKLVDFGARPADEKLRHVRGKFVQALDLMMGEPNNTPYYTSVIEKMAVAVVEEVPFKIDVEPPAVPLVHNGALNLRVVTTRKEGFTAPITVRMLWLPPNVGAQPTVQIPDGQNEVLYTLNANANAETREWKMAVIGESNAGQGEILASSSLFPVRVAPPYFAMKLEMAAIEQGQSGEIVGKIEHHKPFEGKAKLVLQGLPAKVEAAPVEITKDDSEVHFKIITTPETPTGQHKQLFCYAEVPEAGTIIPHNVGHGGVLRVDAPPPAPAAPAPEAPVAAAPSPPAGEPVKQLSRLEKLRQEAKARRQ